jgi:arabinogalactan oligomer/maltooligosaccharide transport system permease protein
MRDGLVTPSRPEMSLVWDPAKDLLRDILERGEPLDEALARARHTLEVTSRPDPPAADPGPYETAASALLLALALYAAVRAVRTDALRRAVRPGARFAYGLALPAFAAMGALVVVPFLAGAAVSMFSYRAGEWTFVGLSNFSAVLSPSDVPPTRPGSFYFILVVTALWTFANVALHVAIGVALALLLRRPWLALRGAYRVLLILPWAVPSYITALIWKGMFNQQFGAVNALLSSLGLEPVSWFSRFSTAFAANLVTNTWLGFPFMMVVTLGALQGIPPELEEVAALEGATRRQRFSMVVLPAIRPALLPAVVLGSVWTFNMFNVIYLVSGGEPAGSTEILISEAYMWAFVRQHRYGYAAAYAVLIFAILLVGARLAPAGSEAPAGASG